MPREFPRSRRVEEQIQRILSDALRTEVGDPRLRGLMITEVRVSRDLSVAKVYYSVLDASGAESLLAERTEGLAAAVGFLRGRLAKELRVRHVPELRFLGDESLRRGVALERLITEAAGSKPEPADDAPRVADGDPEP